jgi:hypothetical protein
MKVIPSCRESAAELGGLALAGEFFFERPVGIAPDEDAATVAIGGGGRTEAAEQALEQAEIALGGFCGEELSSKDLSGGIVLHAESGEARTATFEPVVRAAVELHELTFARRARTALAMSGSAAFAWRAEAFLAKKAAQGLATERETFDLVDGGR